MGTLIRQAKEQDIEALLGLYVELHEFHAHRLPERLRVPPVYDDDTLRRVLREMMQNADMALLLVEQTGVLAGLVEVVLQREDVQPLRVARTYGYVQSLVVSEAFRKQGLGQQLLEAAEHWTRERGGSELRLSVWEFAEGPLPFYVALGFRTLKRELVKPC